MSDPAYLRDAYLTELETEVVAVGEDGDRPYAILADTIFYPEGGGQPADHGTLGKLRVTDVQKAPDGIRHYVSQPIDPGAARLELDWARRWDHMQQHTAQHVLTAVALRRFGWRTKAFHLGAEVSDIELDVALLERTDLNRLEDAVAKEIHTARSIVYRSADVADFERLGVRSRRLPDGFNGAVRLVEIEGLDLNTCGGTHLRSTGEIGAFCLLGTEPMRGGVRLFFVAGDRVRRRMSKHEQRNARLRSLLDTGDDELIDVVALRLAREKDLAGSTRRLAEKLAEMVAQQMAARPDAVLDAHWEDRDMSFLQKVARQLVADAADRLALLTAGSGEGAVFVVVAGHESGVDLEDLGARVAEMLDGRGGGRHGIYQGKAGSFDGRAKVLEFLRQS
jgi:alanyl-tRNA synthetase